MNGTEKIRESVYGRSADGRAGLRLTMLDGSVWFHPYSGNSKPICERSSDAERRFLVIA